MRQDLTLAQQLVQAAHATHEVALQYPYRADQPSSLVLIGVPSEHELLRNVARLEGLGIPLTLFREPDLGDAATAFATAPIIGGNRRLFRDHKLWSYDHVTWSKES